MKTEVASEAKGTGRLVLLLLVFPDSLFFTWEMHDIFVERQKLLPLRHCIISSLEPETEQMFTLGNHNPSITCDIRTSCSFLSLDLSSLFVFGCNSSSSSCCPLLRFLLHPLNFYPLLFHVTGKGKVKDFPGRILSQTSLSLAYIVQGSWFMWHQSFTLKYYYWASGFTWLWRWQETSINFDLTFVQVNAQ